MKLKVLFSILLLTFYFTLSAQQKPRVAVYVTGDNPINEIVGSSLEDGLAHDGKYTAVERTASFLRELSKEHDYQRSGEVDENQIADLGKQFGVEYVCVTSVTDVWGSELYISARIIDVESAEVIATSSSSCSKSSSSDLVKALDKLSKDLLGAMNISKSTKTSKVAIYVTKTGNKDVDVILGDQLVAGFASSGKYLAIERTSRFLSEIKKEQGYQQSGAVDDDELTKLGQKFGVQYVCVAKTTKWGGDYFISARLIDVKTGEIVNSNNAQGKKLNNSQNVVDVASEIAQRLSGRTINEEAEWQKQEARRKKEEAERAEQRRKEEAERLARQQQEEERRQKEAAEKAEKARVQKLIDKPWRDILRERTKPKRKYESGTYAYGHIAKGYGVYLWSDGDMYCGKRDEDGEKSGIAMYVGYVSNCPGSAAYVGYYEDNERDDGVGKVYDKSGKLIYNGRFRNDKPRDTYPAYNSNSKWTFETDNFKNGDKYIGEKYDGKRHGRGIYIWSNGTAWYGEWRDGKKEGWGIALFPNGSSTTFCTGWYENDVIKVNTQTCY